MNRYSIKITVYLIAISIVACAYLVQIRIHEKSYLNLDEVDYMQAAHKGIKANYFEYGTMQPKNFILFCIAKRDKDTATLKRLAANYNEISDVYLLRHLHPPLPIYYLSLFQNKDPIAETVIVHWSNFPLLMGCFLLSLFIFIKFYKSHFTEITLGLLLILSFFLSPFCLDLFSGINFHSFEVLFITIFCGALISYSRSDRRKVTYLALAMAALLCTLDMSLFVILPCTIICLFLQNGLLVKERIGILMRFIFLTFLFIFLIWMGGILKLSLFRNLSNYIYRIFFHADDEYSKLSAWSAWLIIIKANIILFSELAIVGIIYLRRIRKVSWHSKVFVFIGIMYCLAFTPFLHTSNYIVPGICLILFGFLCMILEYEELFINDQNWAQPVIIVVSVIAIICILKSDNFRKEKMECRKARSEYRDDYEFIKRNLAPSGNYYAYFSNTINYYCSLHTSELAIFSYVTPQFSKRENLMYKSLMPDIAANKIDGLILLKGINFPKSEMNFLKTTGFSADTLNNFIVLLKK